MTDLVKLLRDEDSYYRLQEKHWCIDGEELERQRLAAADRIETQAREIERLRGLLREAEVKLTDVQGAYATRQYSANLLSRIRVALAGDSHEQ